MGGETKQQNTTIKVRLHPTAQQAELFEKTFDCCRYLWNKMLSEQEEFYAATDIHYLPTPAKYKKEAPFLKEVDSLALCSVHQNLRRAFQKFFEQPQHYRHPVFKTKKRGVRAYTTYRSTHSNTLYLTKDSVRLPKVGLVRATFHRRPLHGWELKSATVSRSTGGAYDCSLLFEYTVSVPEPEWEQEPRGVGLFDSFSCLYVDSTGRRVKLPDWIARSEAKLAHQQRKLSGMKYGSKHYQKQLQKVQRQYEHISNQRKDFLHKESRRIANEWDVVCVRDTDLTKIPSQFPVTRDAARGFGQLRIYLQYKLERQGKQYLTIDQYFPCVRTCHSCGYVREVLPPRERRWHCPSCGADLVRETNAARNILTQGLTQLQERRTLKRSA